MTDAVSAWGDVEPEPVNWSSGDWTVELRGNELADIRYRDTLVLRSIRAVARDQDWNTVPTEVRRVETTDDGIELELRMLGLGADLSARLSVTARGSYPEASALLVSFRAECRTDFSTNRLGLVVLHPATIAGTALRVAHPDGSESSTVFPERISPHQPALDIAGLGWTTGDIDARLSFEGDVFEMEDQRNWTDASFKTYSTPLALPFPRTVSTGEVIEQAVELTCRPSREPSARPSVAPAGQRRVVRLEPSGDRIPSIALGATTGALEPAGVPPEADALLVELDARTRIWRATLDRARREAAAIPLDVRIIAASAADLEPVVAALSDTDVVRLGVYDGKTHVSEPDLWDALIAACDEWGIRTELVGGTRAHFTELNRTHHRLPESIAAVTFSLTPQMHARERAQLVESIPMQRRVALDAVAIARGRPVHIGPVTLRPRFNAVATTPGGAADAVATDPENGTDARQAAPAMLAWVIASAAALSVEGVESICYAEASGPRGVRALSGEAYPVATAIAWLHELSGRPGLYAVEAPEGVWALGAEADPDSERPGVALLANLRSEPIALALSTGGVAHDVELPPLSGLRVPLS